MASNKKKQKALEELDIAKKQYDDTHNDLSEVYEAHNAARDAAYQEVNRAEVLMDSIKHKPVLGKLSRLSKIKAEKQKYLSKEEINRAEKVKLLEANAAGVAVVGAAAGVAVSFKDYIFDRFDLDSDRKTPWLNPKTSVVLLVVAVFIVVFWIAYVISQRIKRNTVRKILEETKQVRAQTQKEKDEAKKLKELTIKINGHTEVLSHRIAVLGQYYDAEFKAIPKEHQELLVDYKNEAEALISFLNK